MNRKLSTAADVAAATAAGAYPVTKATGLHLQVTATGRKSWVYRYRLGGARREMGLGSADRVTLIDARKAAVAAAASRDKGIDPIDQRKRDREAALAASRPIKKQTFEEAVEAFITTQAPSWKKRYAVAQFRAPFVKWIYPILGAMDVRDIGVPHVVAALKDVWTARPDTGRVLRARIELILDAAGAAGFRDRNLSNPAKLKGNIKLLLPQSKLKRTHYKRPKLDDAPALYRTFAAAEGTAFAVWTFMILTTARPSEALRASWSEIDLDKRLWVIPGSRMKAGREHIVPLSSAALAVLQRQATRRSSDAVFPGADGIHPLGYTTFAVAPVRLGLTGFSPHGFRSVFRDVAGDVLDVDRDIAEAQLAHSLNDTEGAYRRQTAVERRRAVLERYALWLEGHPEGAAGGVIPFPKVKAAS